MKKSLLFSGMLALALSFSFVACSDNDDPAPSPTPDPVDVASITEAQLTAAVNQYVDAVVVPTYADLQNKNVALHNAVTAFRQNPTDANFKAACEAWLSAREPWESSEAFLFGPVADKGLDPNMDSWPLDQEAIVAILNSQDWAEMEWEGDYDEDDEAIASKQEVRGFHTLEYLIFKDGEARSTTAKSGSKDAIDLEYADADAAAWGNYMENVARLLRADATTLYDDWTKSYNGGDSYATIFKAHDGRQDFSSALNCVEQLIDGCTDIANEVGSTKIGDPYNLYTSGDTEGALYAVESWYSWHSRDDYANNIRSIRNAYFGSRDGKVNPNSLSAIVAKLDADLDARVKNAIQGAIDAILAIPQPFRNNINSAEAKAAMAACGELESILDEELKPYIQDHTK